MAGRRQMKTAAAAASSTAATRTGRSTVRAGPGCVPCRGLPTRASDAYGKPSNVSVGHRRGSELDEVVLPDSQRDKSELGGRSGSSRAVGGLD